MITKSTSRARLCVLCLLRPRSPPSPMPHRHPPATAAAQTQGGGRWKACGDDVKKFCANIDKGKGQVRACLDSHAAELVGFMQDRSRAEHAAKDDAGAVTRRPLQQYQSCHAQRRHAAAGRNLLCAINRRRCADATRCGTSRTRDGNCARFR